MDLDSITFAINQKLEKLCPDDGLYEDSGISSYASSDSLENNIYTRQNDPDFIDMVKVETILMYLDSLLTNWYPHFDEHSIDFTQLTDSDIFRIQQLLSPEYKPQLYKQLDLINEFPIDNNLPGSKNAPNETPTKHLTYTNTPKLDQLTTFPSSENDCDVVGYISQAPPKQYYDPEYIATYCTRPTFFISNDHILNSGWYSYFQSLIPSVFLQNGLYIPILHLLIVGQTSWIGILFKIIQTIPIILVSVLVLFNYNVFLRDWFLPSISTVHFIKEYFDEVNVNATTAKFAETAGLTTFSDFYSDFYGNYVKLPISVRQSILLNNPHNFSHFPHFIIKYESLYSFLMVFMWAFVLFSTAIVILCLASYYRCFATSNSLSLQYNKPNYGFYSELQRRTVYTFYCYLNYIFPFSDHFSRNNDHNNNNNDNNNNLNNNTTERTYDGDASDPFLGYKSRSEFLQTPFPPVLPPKIAANHRLRRMVLCEPDRFLSISRCSREETNPFRPHGCHHCSVCGECIIGFDHHCLFIGACVGGINRKYFLTFLFWAALGCTLFIPFGWYVVYKTFNLIFPNTTEVGLDGSIDGGWSQLQTVLHPFITFFCTVLTSAFSLVLCAFAYFHFGLVINDLTTFDSIINNQAKAKNANNRKKQSHRSDFLNQNNFSRNSQNFSEGDDDLEGLDTNEETNKISQNSIQYSYFTDISIPLWKRRLARVMGVNQFLWLIPVDTMYSHRTAKPPSGKTALFSKNTKPSATITNTDDPPKTIYARVGGIDDDTDGEDQLVVVSPNKSIVSLTSDLQMDTPLAQLVNNQPLHELVQYYNDKLYLDDEYFFPHQFTHHHVSSFPLLVPDHFFPDDNSSKRTIDVELNITHLLSTLSQINKNKATNFSSFPSNPPTSHESNPLSHQSSTSVPYTHQPALRPPPHTTPHKPSLSTLSPPPSSIISLHTNLPSHDDAHFKQQLDFLEQEDELFNGADLDSLMSTFESDVDDL